MDTVFFMLWLFSFLGWFFCFFEMNKDREDRDRYEVWMWVCLVLMWIFNFAIRAVTS